MGYHGVIHEIQRIGNTLFWVSASLGRIFSGAVLHPPDSISLHHHALRRHCSARQHFSPGRAT